VSRTLARQLHIHHNTVSQAYTDVTALQLLSRRQGSRLVVRTPEARADMRHPDMDDLINQTIRVARSYGYSIQELSRRVSERLAEEPPDHILVLSSESWDAPAFAARGRKRRQMPRKGLFAPRS